MGVELLELELRHRHIMQSRGEKRDPRKRGRPAKAKVGNRIVASAQGHRDTTAISNERVETTDRQGAPARESGDPPSSGASFFEHESSEKSGVMQKTAAATKANHRP